MEPTAKAHDFLEGLKAILRARDAEALEAFAEDVRPQHILDEWDELEADEREALLRVLPAEKTAELFSNLPEDDQPEALHAMGDPVAKQVLEELDPDDLADTLQNLEAQDPAQASSLKALLEPETLAVVEALGEYEEEEAGGLMTPHFISLRASMTVDQVLAFLRKSAPDAETIYYLYVVDEAHRLQGVLSLRDLIVSASNTPIREIMDPDIVTVQTNTDQEEVARIMADYDFSVLPVIDEEGKLVGIITVDDVLDVVEEEATEDIHRLGAAPIDIDYVRANAWLLFLKRAKWLVLLVVSMTLTTQVLSHYEEVLDQLVILTFFIPLLIGTGGNVGSQVATLVVRALATRELEPSDYFRVFVKECGTGLLLGASFGAFIAFYVSFLSDGDPRIAVALGITMVLIALTANLVGASLPFLFRRFGIDPALTSSPGITTIMDVVGLLIYFRVVLWILGPMLGTGG